MRKRVKTPSILQMEATECGAAALGIVLAYYGRFVPLEELRAECGVSRDGSKAINILKAARRYGMIAYGAQAEELEALTQLTFPFIAFWKFDHFVVVEGIKGNRFYINDPATGPRKISKQAFDRAFTGVILIFELSETFQKKGKPTSIFQSIQQRLRGTTATLLFVLLASLMLVIPGIIIPGFSKIFIDDVLVRSMHSWIMPLLFGMLLTALLRAGLIWCQQHYLLRLQIKLILTSSAKFLWHVLHLPMRYFNQRYAGDVSERVAANDRIAQLFSSELNTSIVSLISMVFYVLLKVDRGNNLANAQVEHVLHQLADVSIIRHV